jgi:hypothetical protein
MAKEEAEEARTKTGIPRRRPEDCARAIHASQGRICRNGKKSNYLRAVKKKNADSVVSTSGNEDWKRAYERLSDTGSWKSKSPGSSSESRRLAAHATHKDTDNFLVTKHT